MKKTTEEKLQIILVIIVFLCLVYLVLAKNGYLIP